VITFVAIPSETLVGFIIGSLVPAPAVYAPGGPTCTVDDFTVVQAALWAKVGVNLVHAVENEAGQRGASQLVVVCAHLDEAKRAALASCRLAPLRLAV
jgi:hypothetical protein